jgi:hypothetical protein
MYTICTPRRPRGLHRLVSRLRGHSYAKHGVPRMVLSAEGLDSAGLKPWLGNTATLDPARAGLRWPTGPPLILRRRLSEEPPVLVDEAARRQSRQTAEHVQDDQVLHTLSSLAWYALSLRRLPRTNAKRARRRPEAEAEPFRSSLLATNYRSTALPSAAIPSSTPSSHAC